MPNGIAGYEKNVPFMRKKAGNIMTNFLVNLLSPIFTNLGVSVADLTSYIERLSGYIIAILVALVAMIVVMIAAHKAKKGVRHVIRWQAGIAFVAIVAVNM